MHRALTPARPAACALALLLLGAGISAATPRAHHPSSCKPSAPIDVELRLLDSHSGQPARIETRVTANLPVEDLGMEMRFTGGARESGSRSRLAGRLDAGARRALPLTVALPAQGHSEVYVRVTFRAGGARMTRGAYLAFDDGQPARVAQGRLTRGNGDAVLEFPAQGVKP
jgi:hypothetical protein